MSFQQGLSGLNAAAKNLDVIGNNVANASTIKSTLMTEIQAAWAGQKTAQQALDSAATAINKILQQ